MDTAAKPEFRWSTPRGWSQEHLNKPLVNFPHMNSAQEGAFYVRFASESVVRVPEGMSEQGLLVGMKWSQVQEAIDMLSRFLEEPSPETIQSLERGIAQANNGELRTRRSYADMADEPGTRQKESVSEEPTK
jgi:hypothetical protein